MGTQEYIPNTHFTVEFVLNKIKNRDGIGLADKLLSYEVKEISDGSAFFSRILKLTFRWSNSEIDPKSIVLKVPGVQNLHGLMSSALDDNDIEEMIDGSNEFLEYSHSQEINFYRIFHNIDATLKLPQIYYGHEYKRTHNKGLMIMEDLTARTSTVKMLPGLNNEQIESVIDELAKIQARSWQHPECIHAISCTPPPGNDSFMDHMKSVANKLREIQPEVFNDLLDRAEKFFTTVAREQIAYTEPKFGFPPAIVHGDLWAPNVLFTIDENKIPTNDLAAIIDWQSAHAGNPCEDIARLLSVNTTSEYRRSHTQRLLKRYKEEVDHHLNYELFTFDQLNNAYRHCLAHACAFFAFGVPMYYDMPSVVYENDRDAQRKELLDRIQKFIEDALEQYPI